MMDNVETLCVQERVDVSERLHGGESGSEISHRECELRDGRSGLLARANVKRL